MKIVDKTQKREYTLEITLSEQELSDLQCFLGNITRDDIRILLEKQNRGQYEIKRKGKLDNVDKMSTRISDLTDDIYSRVADLTTFDGYLYD